MLRFGQRFGENVRKHTFRFTINQLDHTVLGVIVNEMVPYVDIYCSPLGHVVV